MKCKNCGTELIESETYKRGRWERVSYSCNTCSYSTKIRIRLIPNNPRGIMAKHCSIPWGKNKTHRRNPKKKGRR